MKKLLILLMIFCLMCTACANSGNGGQGNAGGAGTDGAGTAAKGTFELYPAYLILPLGQHLTLDASAAPAGKKLAWSSSDMSVASVDENGRISPVAEGETVITATLLGSEGVTATCSVLIAAGGNIFMWDDEE